MSEITDYDITEAMNQYGGSFVVLLARLFRQADDNNQRRLKNAFPDYFTEYRELVEKRRAIAQR